MTDGLAWVNDPLPEGAAWAPAVCPVCKCNELHWHGAGFYELVGRTAEVVVDGAYLVMPHHEWCPVPFGGDIVNGCPQCGATIIGIEHCPGYTLSVPDPRHGSAPLTGAAEEILADLRAMLAEGPPERAVAHDEVKLNPCGHVFTGDDAAEAMIRYRRVAEKEHAAQTEKQLAGDAPLLAAAEAAGYASLVEAYRQAVERRIGTVAGLRAALVLLTDPRPDVTTT